MDNIIKYWNYLFSNRVEKSFLNNYSMIILQGLFTDSVNT